MRLSLYAAGCHRERNLKRSLAFSESPGGLLRLTHRATCGRSAPPRHDEWPVPSLTAPRARVRSPHRAVPAAARSYRFEAFATRQLSEQQRTRRGDRSVANESIPNIDQVS
jgi:hypothetical protein